MLEQMRSPGQTFGLICSTGVHRHDAGDLSVIEPGEEHPAHAVAERHHLDGRRRRAELPDHHRRDQPQPHAPLLLRSSAL